MSCPCRMNLTSKCSSPRTNVPVSIYTILHRHLQKHLATFFPFELDHESGTTCIPSDKKKGTGHPRRPLVGRKTKSKRAGKNSTCKNNFFPPVLTLSSAPLTAPGSPGMGTGVNFTLQLQIPHPHPITSRESILTIVGCI